MSFDFDDYLPRVSGLSRGQHIYRIVDFFSAAQAIEDGCLYVPLASTFEDANEGIDAAIELLSVAAGPCAGITKHFDSQAEFIEYQASVANRNYVSCWTRTRESVAMWELYSRDHASIQISTTVGNLEQAAIQFSQAEWSPMSAIADGSHEGQFVYQSKITSVKYDDLATIARRIDRRRRAYDKLDANGKIPRETNYANRGVREEQRAVEYRFAALEHKDLSFAHESEVRLIVSCVSYDRSTLQVAIRDMAEMEGRPSTDVNHPEHPRFMLAYARAILREEAWKRHMRCKPYITIPLHSGFISEITIDPRCADHKKHFIHKYFKAHGIPVTQSSCFGHAASAFAIKSRRKIANDKVE